VFWHTAFKLVLVNSKRESVLRERGVVCHGHGTHCVTHNHHGRVAQLSGQYGVPFGTPYSLSFSLFLSLPFSLYSLSFSLFLSLPFSLSRHSTQVAHGPANLRSSLLEIERDAASQMHAIMIAMTFKYLHRLGVGKLTFEVNLSFRQLFLESFNRLQRLKHHRESSRHQSCARHV
jgi:hypothetical protein